MKKRSWSTALLLLALVGVLCAAALLWQSSQVPNAPPTPAAPSQPVPTATVALPRVSAVPSPPPAPAPAPVPEDDGLPRDQLFITPERQKYADGDLRLHIPKLNVDVPVLNGVDAQTLLRGVGLYDYAQLPGAGDCNVSLAGHRNGLRGGKITDNMPFYYIDTLTEGDFLYLSDRAQIYQYAYDSTEVVEPDDWGPIYRQGFSCLTLTSCTPIGIADHRIIVRGRLAQTLEFTTAYQYPVNREEESP